MAKSWEEIKKEREQQVRSSSNPVQSNTSKMINQGFLTSDPKPQQRKWEDIRKDRGYIEPEPPPTDYWKDESVKTAWKNVNAGINSIPRGIVGVADATIGGLGIKPVNKFLDSYKDYYKKADEELAMLNKGHEFAGGVAQGVGQAIPTMALALMNPAAAASNAFAGTTTAGGTQLVANAASLANPTTLNAARTVAMQLKSNPTLYSSMVTSVGNQYLQGVNEGASREQALKSAIIGGVPSALIEVSGGIENITNILANKTKGVAGALLQSALEEGFEEIVQYPIENIGQKIAYDKNMPLFSMEEQAVINPKEMAFSGLIGGTVGGLMGGGAAGVNTALNKKYSKAIDAEYNTLMQILPEDSPTKQQNEDFKNRMANVTDEVKKRMIDSAREELGINDFESETDKFIRERNRISGQNETISSKSNEMVEQTFNREHSSVKSQNKGSVNVNPITNIFNIQNINNPKEVKQNVYEFYKNSIISDSNTSKPIINKSSGMNIEVSRATINQTFQADNKYIKNQDNEIKVAAMENIVSLIQNGAVEIVDNSKVPSSKVKHADIKGVISFDGVPYDVTLDVRRTDKGNKFFVHSLHTDSKQTENKTSGLIHNGYEQQINPQAYSILDKIGKETGIKIKIVSNIASQDGSNFDFADGQYDRETNTLELSMLAGSDDIILEIAKHELTHMLSQKSPKHYKEYQEYVIKTLKENGKYESLYSYMAMLHNEAGIKYDENYINEELAADAAKMLFTDKSTIDDIAQNNPTLGKKILEIIREIIKKFDTAIQEAKSNIFNINQMKTAEELWMIALNDVIENRQGNVESQQSKAETDSKFSIKDDVIAEVYGTEQFTVWAGENSQIPFGNFDTEKEARDFYNKHKSRLAKFRHSSNLKTDMEYAKTDKEVKELEKLLENSEYIENQYAMYERNKSKPVSINDVIKNIKNDRYRRADMESLAEQVSNGAWDDYEQLTDEELKSDLIDTIESYAEEMNPLERQYDKYGFSVRPPRNIKYSLKDNPYKEKSYHPFKETEKWEEQFERRTKWIREKVDGIKTGKFKGSFGMYATVTPSIKDGKYQITVFDKNDTPMMDAQRNTVDEIAEFLQEDGFVFPEQITKYSLKNIENALVANHDVYKDDKKALKMASEALYDLNRVRYSTKDNSGIVTIADGLTRDFITEGYVNFNGRKFKSFDELAQIMQIYRDPRFETLRYVYVKEKKKVIHDEILGDYNDSTYTIVGHEAVSSRIPGMSSSIPNLPKRSKVTQAQHEKAFYSGMDKMGDRMKRLKADGYFMLHNHPSGNPNPSSNDRHLTKLFANKIDGFIGHIVINSNKYATITLNSYNGIETSIKDIDQQSIDYHKQPSVYNKILDYNTKDSDGTISMDKIASLAKSMQFVDDKSYLLYLDARGAITGLQMIPNGMPLSEMRSSNSKHFRNFIKNRLVDFGAHSAMLITENRRIFDFGLDLIEQKYIMDSIRVYTNSYSEIDAVHGVWRTQPSNYYEWAGIPEGDIQAKRVFSLKAPVEETKDLIAIHNMDEDKLKGTLELGGFPVPSIAITKAEQGHDDFGDISVIFTKDTIDPQLDRRNRVFGSDVYSKRFPFVNYKLNSKVVDRIKSKISELTNEEYRKEFRISLDNDNIANTLQTYKSNGDFVKGYIDEPLLKLAFLKENGIAFKPIMKEKTYGRWEVPLLEKIKKHLGNEEAAITFRNLEDTMKLEPDIRRIVNEFYQSTITEKDLLDMVLYKEPMGFGVMDDLLQQVSRYAREGANKEIEYYKTKEKLEKVTPKKSYRDWLTKLSEGIVERKGVRNDKDLFTPSGNRRSFEQLNDEYTLDSIIKLMRGDVRGEEGFMYGLGNVRAGMTKEFKSIEDIKQHKDKIVSPEEFREIKEKANQEYYKLSNWFSKYYKYMRGSSDAFDISMFETAKKGRIVPTALKANLKDDGFEVRDIPDFMITSALDFLNSLKDMPTEYFEAKPQRGVGFNEVAAIVAPKTTNKELLQDLKNRAIKVVKYDEKIEGDRLQKVNSVKGVKFSLKDSKGKILTQEQAEYFKNSEVRDNEGNLIVLYHGSPNNFNVFNTSLAKDKKSKYQLLFGTHFTTNKEIASKYANDKLSPTVKKGNGSKIYESYLNIKNPLDLTDAKIDVVGIYENSELKSSSNKKMFNSISNILTKEEKKKHIIKNSDGQVYVLSKILDSVTPIRAEQIVRELGYDGIKYDAKYTQGINTYTKDVSYIAFEPEQIKSVDNLEPTYNEDIRYSLRTKEPPKKTIKAYKLLRIDRKTGKLYPLFVGATEETPTGIWLDADEGEMTTDKKTGTQKVKSKLGNLAYRPGWHLGDIPLATHIGVKGDSGKIEYMNQDHVWAEVDVAADINYQAEANKNGINPKTGKMNRAKADIKSIPVDGYYRYKTNPNMTGEWIITGAIKINRVLSDSEAAEIVRKAGYEPLPRTGTDVRYQLRDNKSAKDVEKLQNTVTRLKEQFKLTKGVKLDEKAVRRLARTLLNDYSSTYSKTELEGKLYELYNDIANDSIEFDDMDSITREIARDIIENASVLNDNMHKQYSELRSTLRNSNITIADRYKGDFDAVGGWNEFRKRNIGRIHLTNEGMNIDVLYQELIERYPELFLEDISNPADQLMLIEEVLNGLQAIYENPFNRDINEAVGYLSFEIFDGMTSVPEAKPTFADRKKVEKQKAVESEREKSKTRMEVLRGKNADDVAWLKYQNKDKLTEVLNKEKAKRDGAVAKVRKQYKDETYKTWWSNKLKENDIKSHYQEMIKELRAKKNEQIEQTSSRYKERISNIYEDRKVRDIKKNIGRKVKKLDAMLRKPNQKKHIPKQLDKTIAELLASIDFSTDSQKEKTILKLRDIRAEYEKIAKVSDEDGLAATADPYILEALEELHNKRLVDMSFQELEILKNIIAHFEHLVKTYNKAFMNGKWEDISTKSEKILKELRTDAPKTESAYGVINNFKDMLRWGMVTPQMYFERMGETFYTLWNDLRTSLDKKIVNTRKAQDYMNKLLQNSKDVVKEWTGNKAKTMTFKLESGKTVELTPAQVMSFYLLFKREQARGHILGLGIKAAPIVQKDSKGIKRIKKQFEPTKVTLNDISKILGSMTKEQKRIADGIGVFMNTISKQWVNEATLQNYGYELAKEENYFPIKSDKDFLKSDFDNTNLDPTFTSMGFLKATIKGAGNAIILEDVFDVFTEHADKAATYNAFVGITESTKKIINYKTKDNSIKQAMNKKFGIQAFNYLKKLMVDLQGGLRTDRGMPIINWLIKMNKRSMLGLNLRTVVQQPTSIVRASAMIDIKYLLKGIASKGDMDEMFRYSPIALWKSWGYFNLDTGRTMKDIILDTTPLLDKQYALIQKADDITWTKIWNAVKYEIEDTMPGLKVGSKEFFEAVNERFSNIIDRTQVVDTVLHRSELMRDKDSYVKVITSFMSEPIKQYNIGLAAFEKYENDKTPENRNELIRSMSSLIATTAVVSFTTALYDMAHANDDDDETLLDKWLGDILDNVTGIVPIVKDINSIIQGYSVNRMEYIGITKVWRALNRLYNYLEEIALGKKHKYQFGYILTDFIESISYGTGISVSNVTREIETVMRKYIKIAGKDTITNEIYEYLFKK